MSEQVKNTLESLDAMEEIGFLDSNKLTNDKSEMYDIAIDIVLDILDSLIRDTLGNFDDKALILLLSKMS
jgi:hypothetical protein